MADATAICPSCGQPKGQGYGCAVAPARAEIPETRCNCGLAEFHTCSWGTWDPPQASVEAISEPVPLPAVVWSLEGLKTQHRRGHGLSWICGGVDHCASARYLAIVEWQAGEIADALKRWEEAVRQRDDMQRRWEAAERSAAEWGTVAEDAREERDKLRGDLVSALSMLTVLAKSSPKVWRALCIAKGLPTQDPDGNAIPDWWMRSLAVAALTRESRQ